MNEITHITLKSFPRQLEAHYAAIPPGFEHWAPPSWEGAPSEPLTAIEQICHVRDIEIDGNHVRFQRTLSERNPALTSLDTAALARDRRYSQANAAAACAAFRKARAKTIALIGNLESEQFNRPAIFEEYGPVTLLSLVHYLCSHDQQHLAGMQWLLGKIATARAQASC